MKPGFRQRLLNSHFEDPSLYVRIPWEKYAIQFDLGDISRLSTSEICRITHVFITHTHIDHFIGFDTLLRATLRRDLPLHIYGPPSLTRCVAGKLKGYTWNLIKDYPSIINVFAYNGRTVRHTVFRARNGFKKERVGNVISDGLLLKNPLFEVRAVKLSHGTPCLAYSLKEAAHINIDKNRLKQRGLEAGPWLNEFKQMLREAPSGSETLSVEGKIFRLRELSDLAIISEGQKLCYATDIAISGRNVKNLTSLAKDSDVFYCETYFLEKDRGLALQRFHLTAKTCGAIARKAAVKKLVPIHFSPRYSDCPDEVIQEAMDEFQGH